MAKMGQHLILGLALTGLAFGVRPGDFKVLGPGGGGAMFNPTVSPHDPNTVLISCDMTGAYITHDGGQSWRMFNLRGVVRFFVFDPLDPRVMYAQATGLWRSTDAGDTWKLVYPKPEKITTIVMRSDHADEDLVTNADPLGLSSAFAIDPANSKVLYAAAGEKNHPALFVSRDWGEMWNRQDALPEPPRRIGVDPKSSKDSRTLYIGGQHLVSIKNKTGLRNFSAPESVTFTGISLGFNSASQPILYGVSERGIFISKDGGSNWQKSSFPGSGAKVRAVAASRRHGEVAYVSYSDLSLDGKSWIGVAKTENAGDSWQLVWKESGAAAANVHDAWITPRFG